MEEAASSILTRAVKLDTDKRYTEALICYQEGLKMLMDVMKELPSGTKRSAIACKMEEYIGRGEIIKKKIKDEKTSGNYHERIEINEDSVGHSYESVMGRFLDYSVTSINIQDPYLRNYNQFTNLVRFCELLVKKCKNLKEVSVLTSKDSLANDQQSALFSTLSESLVKDHSVSMTVKYSSTLHDRQIILSSGWVIKIGRGLDYFKPPVVKNSIGTYDMDLRPCRKTTVDIYHMKNVITKNE